MLPWLDLLARDDPAIPVVLPYRDGSGIVIWYGAARTQQTALRLVEELVALVGPTYADFTHRPHLVDPADDPQAALTEAFVEPVLRICPALPEDVEKIRRVIRLYRGLVERRPPELRLAARPLGVLRSRFDRALLAGNETEAQQLFEQILATGRLSPDNRLFLEYPSVCGPRPMGSNRWGRPPPACRSRPHTTAAGAGRRGRGSLPDACRALGGGTGRGGCPGCLPGSWDFSGLGGCSPPGRELSGRGWSKRSCYTPCFSRSLILVNFSRFANCSRRGTRPIGLFCRVTRSCSRTCRVIAKASALTYSEGTGRRWSLARRASAVVVQTNGLGRLLCSRM